MINNLLEYIEQLGYMYFFLIVIIGANLTPVPDPIYIMLAGSYAKNSSFHYVPAFIFTYLGMMISLYTKFLFGKCFSSYALRLFHKPRIKEKIKKVERVISKYGNLAIVASYFLPGLRHIMPLFLGTTGMKNSQYVIVSFSFGFLWTLILFLFGITLNDSPSQVDMMYTAFILAGCLIVYFIYRHRRIMKQRQVNSK